MISPASKLVKENHDLREVLGDIWNYHEEGHWIVITTNGTVKKNGEAVMGRGIAKQAVKKFLSLPKQLGDEIGEWGNRVFFFKKERIITLPVKKNWWEKADIELIEWRVKDLVDWVDIICKHRESIVPIYMVRPGCGNGGLDWKDIKPICEKYLDDRFYIVERLENWKPEKVSK
jgi:hypothetical protein